MKNRIFPTNDPARVLWLNNFAAKIESYATKYAITGDEVNAVKRMAKFFAYWVNVLLQLRDYVSKVTGFKNEMAAGVDANEDNPTQPALPAFDAPPDMVVAGIFPFVMTIAKRIKAHKDYAVSDGNDMGIEGDEMEKVDINAAKPVIKLTLVNGGLVNIGWTKKTFDGVAIYVNRGTGNYEFLAIDTVPDYLDTHTLPAGQSAVWKYKAIYRLNDENAGQWSDEVSITVSGI